MRYRWIFASLLFFSTAIDASITIKGNAESDSGNTFTFSVQEGALRHSATSLGLPLFNFFAAAAPSEGGSGIVNEYSVSLLSESATQFVPLSAETVTYNYGSEVKNPLFDQGVAFFDVFAAEGSILAGSRERPIVVIDGDRTTIYLINNYTASGENVSVLSVHNNDVPSGTLTFSQNIPDATAAVTSGIVQIATANPYIFAAVGANGGSFGDVGSGIALSIIGQVGSFTGPLVIDAQTGSVANPTGNTAFPLDITSDQLKIGADLASIGTVVDMIWHASVGRLYIALDTTGGAAGTDGTRSIAIGRIVPGTNGAKDTFTIDEIIPGSAITGTDSIIAAVGSSATVTARKVREMETSTALPYLVVLGGVDGVSNTQRSVFALPLVSGNSDVTLNGTIANKNATPEALFLQQNDVFYARVIKDPATAAAQVPLSSDMAAQVGGGELFAGDIADLWVTADTVFASVQTADAGQEPGVFFSQALFDANGKIIGWTAWKRAVGLTDATLATFQDNRSGTFISFVENSSGDVQIVKRTEWANGDTNGLEPLVQAVEDEFSKCDGGVLGLHDFVVTSPTLGSETPGLLDISMLVATGYQKVFLAQTSRTVGGAVLPIENGQFGPLRSFDEGTITQTFPSGDSRMISISGGVLDDLGPIVAAEVARDDSNGWLFVGGPNGLAVLSSADGSGWDILSELSDRFLGITSGMSFKMIDGFCNVRKLIFDDQYLYVITDTEISRIDLILGDPGLGDVNATTIVTNETIPELRCGGVFLDAIVSEKLILLGTSGGLFRLANGLDARSIDLNSSTWIQVPTPEGVGPVRQLFAISQTGRAQDIARQDGGGTLYTLSAYRGTNQGQLHRYHIMQVTTGSIQDDTVQRIDDLYIADIPSYFVSFGLFRNLVATDGSIFYGTRDGSCDGPSQVTLLSSPNGVVQTGTRFVKNEIVPVDLCDSTLISAMIQNSATGTWLIAGDHGLRANE